MKGIKQVTPVIDLKVRSLCKREYPGHPKGCPNWNKRKACPPQAPRITDMLDFDKPIYVAYNKFNFQAHCNRMRTAHSSWSKRQVTCCLYWQNTARKQLREIVDMFLLTHNQRGLTVLYIPEANGVDVTATMEKIGITLEWPPVSVTYQVALLGSPKEKKGPEMVSTD